MRGTARSSSSSSKRQRLERRVADRLDHDRQVEVAVFEQLQQGARAALAEGQRDARVLARERRQGARKQMRADARRRADRQTALAQPAQLLNLDARLLQLLQDGARVSEEQRARLGQRHVALHAMKERRAQLILELPDLLADRRLRHIELFGRARKVQMPRHGLEVRELVNFHAAQQPAVSSQQSAVSSQRPASHALADVFSQSYADIVPACEDHIKRGVAAGRSAQRACERSSDWRRGAASSPDPERHDARALRAGLQAPPTRKKRRARDVHESASIGTAYCSQA